MDLGELFSESLRAIRANALRSFLTLLGIIIGVATLVSVVSVISGLNIYVRDKVFALSPDVFVVARFGIILSREEFLDALKRPKISWDDYRRLSSLLTKAVGVGAQTSTKQPVRFLGHRLADVHVYGTTANYGRMLNLDVAQGRYFVDSEAHTAQALAVIGADVKDELFPQLDPLGRTVLVGGLPCRVIGLLAKQGKTLGESRDNQVYIPIEAYRNSFGSRDSLDLMIQARGGVAGVADAADEARALLRALRHTAFHAPDPFGIITAENLQTLWRQISAAAFILTILIASVSLGVGGIVIMNIMLVAVVERTREIGVRLAVGARKADIRRQFLLEAALLSLAGGLAGVLLAAAAAAGVKNFLHFPVELTPGIVVLGLALSALVGISAGYWPARSASNLPVVDALRAE
jgi:putative ABC transport system permease protein